MEVDVFIIYYLFFFLKDIIVMFFKVEMDFMQVNVWCMVWDGDKWVLVCMLIIDFIYVVFVYLEMKFLSYIGSLLEYKQILVECNEGFYLVKDDLLYLYYLIDKDLLQKMIIYFFYNSNKI